MIELRSRAADSPQVPPVMRHQAMPFFIRASRQPADALRLTEPGMGRSPRVTFLPVARLITAGAEFGKVTDVQERRVFFGGGGSGGSMIRLGAVSRRGELNEKEAPYGIAGSAADRTYFSSSRYAAMNFGVPPQGAVQRYGGEGFPPFLAACSFSCPFSLSQHSGLRWLQQQVRAATLSREQPHWL